MGKPKGKKNKGADDFSDDGGADTIATEGSEGGAVPQPTSGPKKTEPKWQAKKKGNKEEEVHAVKSDDSDEKQAVASVKTKKNAKKSKADTDDRDNEEPAPPAKTSKQKQKKKNRGDESSDDEGLAHKVGNLKLSAASPEAPRRGAAKQAKGFSALGNGDSSEDDSTAVPSVPSLKKQANAKAAKIVSDDDDFDIDMPAAPSLKGKGSAVQARGFMMFADDDDEEVDATGSHSDKDDEQAKPTGEQQPAQKSKPKKDKKKEKKKEVKAADDDDIDAILAKLDDKSGTAKGKKEKGKSTTAKEVTDVVSEPQAPAAAGPLKEMTAEELADELESSQKKKKKGKKAEKEPAAGLKDEVESAAKSVTAEELAEEMEEADLKKKKKGKKGDKGAATSDAVPAVASTTSAQPVVQKKEKETPSAKKETDQKATDAAPKAQDAAPGEPAVGAEQDTGEGAADDSKKKKKKKGKEEKEEKKKPVNKRVEIMKEALAKLKEEQERLQREAEEKERREEEARRLKEEQLRLEEERKQRKKQKEKEKIERKKKEGTFLTEKQKQDRKRAIQMVEALGMSLPSRDAGPKKPVYGRQRKGKKPEPSEGTKDANEGVVTAENEDKEDEDEDEEEAVVVDSGTTSATIEADAASAPAEPEAAAAAAPEIESEDLKDDWALSSGDENETGSAKGAGEHVAVPATKEVANRASAPLKSRPAHQAEAVNVLKDNMAKAAALAAAIDAAAAEESSEESESEEDESDDEEEDEEEDLSPKERALARITKRQEEAEKKRSTERLRAAVVCVLGHVDTGKTKILDKLRHTNVQDNEAGGITQQIGATNVPLDAIKEQTKMCKEFVKFELRLPGLLIIDTPGHESFSNLRSRGSSLCDIAILVVDIMHGLEPQTIESINLLKQRKTPFIVALNKIDRLFQWKTNPHADVVNTIKKQQLNTKQEFDERAKGIIVQFAEQGLNAALFYENKNPREYVSLVPTSAHTGDGMGNLIALVCEMTQLYLAKRVALSEDLRATVMEVKAIAGLGTTIDVILVDGRLRVGDIIIVPGIEGPIVTHIRELLLPQPMRELRVKGQYVHNKEVVAAQGVKIIAKELEKALAGLPLYVAQQDDEIEVYKEWLADALKNVLNSIKLSERGVYVQSSTLGSLEALLEYLRTVKVPYAGINIGPVHKRDVMRASVMLEHGEVEHSCILAFDVKVERDAQEMADNLGVRIFTADIIYHLFDAFQKYQDELIRRGREENKAIAVFPCKLRVLPQYIFNSRDPIVMGVTVEDGFICPGTPICVPSKEFVDLGVVSSVEFNHKPIEAGRKGQEVCIKIDAIPGEPPKMFGRHFDENDMLMSKISRNSIDAVKKYFKAEMSTSDWKLVIELKKIFDIV